VSALRHTIDVTVYTTSLSTWVEVARRSPCERLVVARCCAALRKKFAGEVAIKTLCADFGQRLVGTREGFGLVMDITKSCLLNRLIYAGEALRTQPCPIHGGEWSGYQECPAGCNFGYDATGWLAEGASEVSGSGGAV